MPTTYNLLALIDDRMSAIEPIVSDTEDRAIAFASGLLQERTKGHHPMFAKLKVRWGLDTGDRDTGEVTLATGPVVGGFDIVSFGGAVKMVWTASGWVR